MSKVMSGPSNQAAKGLLIPGNIINLYNRPQTQVPAGPGGIQQGTISTPALPAAYPAMAAIPGREYGDYKGAASTTYSKSFNFGGHEVLLPTVVNGKFLTDKEAVARYLATGEHLGHFDNADNADAYATALHESQQAMGERYGPVTLADGTKGLAR